MTIFMAIYAAGVLLALAGLVAACISDFRTMTIPNFMPIMVAAGFVVAYGGAAGVAQDGGPVLFSSLAVHAVAFVLIFAVTFLMFALGVWGAGDSKLAAAIGLWLGLAGVVPFLLMMSIAGLGLVAVFPILRRMSRVPLWLGPDSWWGRLAHGEKTVPYGIAIAVGAIWAFYRLGYFVPLS
jgi:prepilin peptidase CpaA